MIDVERCWKAMDNIRVIGSPLPLEPARKEVIEDAIKAIGSDGANALTNAYLGVKNYAHFGDQRCDCEYGMGPKHGSIVFRIARVDKGVMGADEIYLLECVRDFGAWRDPDKKPSSNVHDWNGQNLCDLIAERYKASGRLLALEKELAAASVESSVVAA